MLLDALTKHIAPFLSGLWNSVVLWRSLALAAWGLLSVAWWQREHLRQWLMRLSQMEHDKRLFLGVDEIADESALMGIVDSLLDTASLSRTGMQVLARLNEYLGLESNQHLSRPLRDAAVDLRIALSAALDFTACNFFDHGEAADGSDCFCLHPEFNVDQKWPVDPMDMTRFDHYVKQLDKRAVALGDRYRHYRRAVKRKLHV